MDEENQNEGQEQKDLPEQLVGKGLNYVGQMGKRGLKKAGKEVGKKLGKVLAEATKKIAVFIATHIVPVLIVVAILIIVFIIIAGADSFLDDAIAEDTDTVTYQAVKEYCTMDENGIRFNKQLFMENIVKELNQSGIDLNDLGFGDDGDYRVATQNTVSGETEIIYQDTDPYTQATEYLYKFITASLVGEFPYIEGSDEEVKGIIKVKRKTAKTEEEAKKEAKDLIFIGYDKFQEMLKTEDDALKDEMMNYFTLDESWNLCIIKPYKKTINTYDHGNLVNTVGEYTISEIKIPYRDMVAQYTVPFLFLINLQLVTHNADYVAAVAELMSKQSEIEFTIFDQFTTNTNVYNYKATRHAWQLQNIGTSGETVTGVSHQEWVQVTFDIDETTETIIETDNVKATVTKAKTWVIEQETNYEMQVTPEYPYGENGTTNSLPDQPEPGGHGSWDTDRSEYFFTEIIKREWMKAGDTITKILPSEFMGLWSNETGKYEKGAPYLPTGEGLPGKIVKYRQFGSSEENDRPIINIVTSQQDLYERLEQSVTTQKHAELLKAMLKIYLNGEYLDESTFTTYAFKEMYEPFEYVEGSYVGSFDVHDESLFITDLETLKKALAGGYSHSDELVKNAQAFLDMQEKYKVNALFAASVSITETSGGRKGHAIDGCNNWFNITGKNSTGCKTTVSKKGTVYHWRIYSTVHAGIDAFGWNIAEGSNYYTQGRYTVGDIGQKYCPDTAEHPTQAEDWIEATLAQMSRFYEAVGIDISPIIEGIEGSDYGYEIPGEALSDPQFAAMFEEAQKYLGTPYVWGGSSPQTGFDCSGFVSWVINQSGVGSVGRSTANGLRKYCAYVPKEQAKPGDLIFFQKTYATSGASHVGIYIGDGKMIHCGDPISITSIETSYWQNHFLDFGRISK